MPNSSVPTNEPEIQSWHAHIYFDAASKDQARALRDAAAESFKGRAAIGRFHERPVGPHPAWSNQIAFAPELFAEVVSWLTLNHGNLDVFIHPNTGDTLADHRDRALWLGKSYDLILSALTE
jgi:DOPA 4,5-dioxygenase